MKYYVFVDNSNLFIEGKRASAVRAGFAGSLEDAHANNIENSSWRMDFGQLLLLAINQQKEALGKAYLFGSTPPGNDSLWSAIEEAKFDVITWSRNASNKEKAVDASMLQKINVHLYEGSEEGDVFVLLTGDGDFLPCAKKLKEKNRLLKIVFWENVSSALRNVADEYVNLSERIDEITKI